MNTYKVTAVILVRAKDEKDAVDTIDALVTQASPFDDGSEVVDVGTIISLVKTEGANG
ncbi:MAG: hypothetical protein K2Z81_17300 [Cyanobacteria bacterium]|nr:hypothetical protein [Cyanobacteriota bacterium]